MEGELNQHRAEIEKQIADNKVKSAEIQRLLSELERFSETSSSKNFSEGEVPNMWASQDFNDNPSEPFKFDASEKQQQDNAFRKKQFDEHEEEMRARAALRARLIQEADKLFSGMNKDEKIRKEVNICSMQEYVQRMIDLGLKLDPVKVDDVFEKYGSEGSMSPVQFEEFKNSQK